FWANCRFRDIAQQELDNLSAELASHFSPALVLNHRAKRCWPQWETSSTLPDHCASEKNCPTPAHPSAYVYRCNQKAPTHPNPATPHKMPTSVIPQREIHWAGIR